MKLSILVLAASLSTLTCQAGTELASTDSWLQAPVWASGSDNSGGTSKHKLSSQSSLPASPFAPGTNNLAIDLGQVFLLGNLGNNYNDSIGAQIHYTYGVSDLFGFDSSLGYSQHSDGKFSMTTALTGLRMNLAWYDKVVPYIVFGFGFYRPSMDYATPGAAQMSNLSPVLFGLHAGPGVDLELTRQIFFGASLTFNDAFGETNITPAGPINVGGTFTTCLVHAGYTF